jgi:hypothetical protein
LAASAGLEDECSVAQLRAIAGQAMQMEGKILSHFPPKCGSIKALGFTPHAKAGIKVINTREASIK